ncbi:MAG: HAD-IA family hydrolase [bacterium]
MNLKIIVLDFDGVIVESNRIKHKAFARIFKVYPEYYSKIMSYHYSHNAVNRHEKFKYIIEHIFKRRYDPKLAVKWAKDFSDLTRKRIISCRCVEGALKFLRAFSKKYKLYLASATPIDELKIILKAKKLDRYFKIIYGAPVKKKLMFKEILRKEKVKPKEMLFIGDSEEDYKAAKELKIPFLARISDYKFKNYKINKFNNLTEIEEYIHNLS